MPGIAIHSAGTDMLLFEGNDCTGMNADYIHGTHNLITLYRNQLIGWDNGMAKQTSAVYLYCFSRYFSFIGNVLGKQGYHTHYEDLTPDGTDADHSIFTLGWGGNQGGTSVLKNDPLTVTTAMRWGNFDTVTNTARWEASEVPSSLGALGNPVPATHRLPASLYLSGKPSWWGSMPWPAVGPDVSGGTDSTGHVFANPAEVCCKSCAVDPAYPEDISGLHVLVFNASKHYPSAQSAP